MSEELKPCPFCGGMPKVNDWTLKGITDKRCFCDNEKWPVYLSKTIAIDGWNTRPIEDALNARIAELEELIEKLVDEGCVIAERFSVKGGSEADLEDWENVIDEYKAVMPEVQE